MSFLKSIFGGKDKRPSLLTVAEVRDLQVSAIRKALPDLLLELVDERTFTVTTPEGDIGTSSVDHLYRTYVDDISRLDLLIRNGVRSLTRALAKTPKSPDALVVVARPADYGAGQDIKLVLRPLAGDVALLLAIDHEDALEPVQTRELADLGLDETAAFGRAIENLPSRLGKLSTGQFADWMFHVNAESSLATGALALPHLWGDVSRPRVVFVDTRDMFFWAYADDPRAVSQVRLYATRRMEEFDTLSKTILMFDGENWTDIGLEDL